MRKVLMAAHQFPPVGGSGVQRTTKFVKYIRNFAWEPVVFTRDIKGLHLRDDSLAGDIPPKVKIIRSKPWNLTELPGVLSLFGKIMNRKVLIPDGESLWQFFGRKMAAQTVIDEGINLIYTTSYPYSAHLMGQHLKRKFPHIPWVADFRDEWTKNPNILDYNYNKIRKSVEKNMEASILREADCVITNTPLMMENFVEDDESLRSKFFVIPNGYDEEDFSEIKPLFHKNTAFTITYTGLLYGRRKPDLFFQALGELLDEGQISRTDFQVRLIGSFKNSHINSLLTKFGIQDVVNLHPYMKHKESIEALIGSDALLLLAGSGEEAFYLGKIFEYMRTGRPILAIVPDKGAAAQLIRETCTGLVSDSSDHSSTKRNILQMYRQWQNNKTSFAPDWSKISRFERKVLTKQLTEVFEKALQRVGRS